MIGTDIDIALETVKVRFQLAYLLTLLPEALRALRRTEAYVGHFYLQSVVKAGPSPSQMPSSEAHRVRLLLPRSKLSFGERGSGPGPPKYGHRRQREGTRVGQQVNPAHKEARKAFLEEVTCSLTSAVGFKEATVAGQAGMEVVGGILR